MEYRIEVSYDIRRHGWGSLDNAAEIISRGECGGSGTGNGHRDLSFYYKTLRRAQNAVKRFELDPRFEVHGEPEAV